MNRCSQTPGRAVPPQNQRGAAVVEFALILPILLILLVGTIDASLALYDKAVITNASREGARAGIVARSPSLTDAQIQQIVQNYLQGALVSLGSTSALPAVQIQKGIWNGDPTLQVTVRYTFQGVGLGSLFDSLGNPWVLQSSTLMVYE
jgi:Flp pilus assembly protein TadG